jgi:hypothetical protein
LLEDRLEDGLVAQVEAAVGARNADFHAARCCNFRARSDGTIRPWPTTPRGARSTT